VVITGSCCNCCIYFCCVWKCDSIISKSVFTSWR